MIGFSELIGGTRDLTIGDVASGPGHFGFSLAGHAARIVGIDPSPNMLKQFRDLGSKFAIPRESLKGKMCCRQIKFYSGVYGWSRDGFAFQGF